MSKIKPYHFTSPLVQQEYQVDSTLQNFGQEYGFYSISHPIAGVVTENLSDIDVTNEALRSFSAIPDPEQREYSSDEILAKVMAYRNLKVGTKITLLDSVYIVDQVIDLWRGMPAFGLIPQEKGKVPILLYRGTDMNLISEKGWASILSDLDTTGPGHSTFLRAREEIHQWLKKVKKEYQPARVIGFSLGGAFVFYTLIYESPLLSSEYPSVAFNPPGISKEMHEKWESQKKEVPLFTFVNQGDIVSQIGFFLDNVWEITLEHSMDVIQAHTTLISTQPSFKATAIDVKEENQSRMTVIKK